MGRFRVRSFDHRLSAYSAGAALAWAILAVSAPARAEDPPKVTAVVPKFRSDPTELTGVYFDALLPASTPFELRVRAPESGNVGGSVEIWPKTGETCRQRGRKQHYRLRMTPSGEKDDRVLRTEVPALQVDQDYCFQFELRRTPTDPELDRVAIVASNALLARVLARENCYSVEPASTQAFEQALSDAAAPLRTENTIKDAADVALRAFAVQSRATCVPLADAIAKADQDALGLKAAVQTVADKMRGLSAAAAPGPQRSPSVLLNDKIRLAETLFAKDTQESDLDAAAEQLAARAAQESGTQKQALQSWSNALASFRRELKAAGADAGKRAKALQGWANDLKRPETGRLPSLSFIELATGTGFISAAAYKQKPATISRIEDVEKQLDALARVPGALDFKKAVHDYGTALANQALAANDAKATGEEIAKQTEATRAALLTALKGETTRGALAVAFTGGAAGSAGEGKTPAAANYAAVDAGVAFARPSGSDAQHVWVLPYIGLNLYAVPVDRNVGLSDLVGDTFWQRASLTIGMTLTEPSLRGRTIKSVLFDNYPLAAFGIRLTPFTRITAGGVFYWLDAANPASNNVELHVAPYVAASLDIDVIHMLTQAKL